MKTDHCFVLSIVIFFVGVLFGTTLFTGYLELMPETFFPALATLIAAFLGAGTAFLLQDQKEIRKTAVQNVGLGNEIIAILGDHANQLESFRVSHIDDFREVEHNWLRILPLPYEMRPNVELKISNLAFLWQKGDASLTTKVSAAKFSFSLAIDLINKRSELHADEIQSKFNEKNFVQGTNIDINQVYKILGPKISATMPGLTKDMINTVDTTIKLLLEIGTELHEEIKRIYPNETVLKIVPRKE